jgi:phosphate transport system protein
MQTAPGQITQLRDKILLLGGAAEDAIARAVRALIDRDGDLAASVIKEDDEIDRMENQIDQDCTDLLLKNEYSSDDLLFVIAVSRTAPIIERIADHAVNIAKHALNIINEPQLKPYIDLPKLALVAQEMVLDSLNALTRQNCQLAHQTIRKDDQADSLYHSIHEELIEIMQRNPKTVRCVVELIFIAKHLERIADYATNICEMVIYMVEGRVIKHSPEAF